MRIVIDIQGAQTKSRFRGIGRYVLAFAQAVCRNKGNHEIILALNGLFPETIQPIRDAFAGLLPKENIRVWHAVGPVMGKDNGNDQRREIAELTRESFLESLQPDVVHICSLFEGFVDDAISSIALLSSNVPVSVAYYDLIPLLNAEKYLAPNPIYARYYQRKIDYLKRASLFLAISEYSRQECIRELPATADKVVNVSTAIDPMFQPSASEAPYSAELCQKFELECPFVLYTGGADERKNLPRLIEAFAQLPLDLRNEHQLVFAGNMPESEISQLRVLASKFGLPAHKVRFTGYISDQELLGLYNLAKLFVFPSWHEGFGLPALEAMACGTPAIGSNLTSIPEVIGLEEALFDPLEVTSITNKMTIALQDGAFRERLQTHGLQQAKKFSWDATAVKAIEAWEMLPRPAAKTYAESNKHEQSFTNLLVPHIKATNSKELLQLADCISQNKYSGVERQLFLDVSEICRHDAATGVQRVVRSYLKQFLAAPPAGFRVEPVYATLKNEYRYARQFTAKFLGQPTSGLEDLPLHWQRGDIFFGLDMQHHVQIKHQPFYQLLRSQGVTVKFLVYDLLPIQLADAFKRSNSKELHEQWLRMIAGTDGAICISKATADEYANWLNESHVTVSPLFQNSWVHIGADIQESAPSHGVPSDAVSVLNALRSRNSFLCVSTLEPRKRQKQILDAFELLWADGKDINLVLVGKEGWKVEPLVEQICNHAEFGKRLFWLNGISDEYLEQVYKASTCLILASINEGFGLPLIEAARYGMPIIARDIPVFREIADDCAHYFTGDEPVNLASSVVSWLSLLSANRQPKSENINWLNWVESSEQLKIAILEAPYSRKQILVDISELIQRDARTGIQRVVRNIIAEWLNKPVSGYQIKLVYASCSSGYKYATKFTANFFGKNSDELSDDLISYGPGDIFFALDYQPTVQVSHRKTYQSMRSEGVSVVFMVYDLLCLQMPQHFVAGSDDQYKAWLEVVSEANGAICISESVALELEDYRNADITDKPLNYAIDWFHLGSDTQDAEKVIGLPSDSAAILEKIYSRDSFLMVSTLEPRKGHSLVLSAFEKLWQEGIDAHLVIVGKEGWLVDNLVERLKSHPEQQKRLFWLSGISDQYLDKVYAASRCLISASEGEGFGLPLIEAARHGVPIIASDLPVFREVARDNAYYLKGNSADLLAEDIKNWLELYRADLHPKSHNIPWHTWEASASNLLMKLLSSHGDSNTSEHLKLPAFSKQTLSQVKYPAAPALPLPAGLSERELFQFVTSVRVADAPEKEMRAYGAHDFKRFVYTMGLAKDAFKTGKCLELGANPYFTTMLLDQFSDLDLSLANYFGHSNNGEHSQSVRYCEPRSTLQKLKTFSYQHFNIETDTFPFPDNEFDIVIFAEIIEHLLNDPCNVLREIKRVLKPHGALILTTPNVARLENVAKLIEGTNIYDPYSGYGPYGRHNREYTLEEIESLLRFEGFEPQISFTADVHANHAGSHCPLPDLAPLIMQSAQNRGQYIFVQAFARPDKNSEQRPNWLYRSYPEGALV